MITMSVGFYITWTKAPPEEVDPNASIVSAPKFALETTISDMNDIDKYRYLKSWKLFAKFYQICFVIIFALLISQLLSIPFEVIHGETNVWTDLETETHHKFVWRNILVPLCVLGVEFLQNTIPFFTR